MSASARVNPYRYVPTADLLAALECSRWDAAEAASNAADNDLAFLAVVIADTEAELARRERLRSHPLAPAWPDRRAELDAIRERIDLVAFVERWAAVRFRRVGRQLRAYCPFPDHPAHSPGFVVNPDKQLWHCFGCLRGGDVFSFAEAWYGLSFPAVVDLLAREAGIERPAVASRPRSDRPRVRVGSVRLA